MPHVILYIASSLDGFIAREDGAVDWLDPFNTIDYGFNDFYKTIDTVIMGRTTFEHGKKLGGSFTGSKTIVLSSNSNLKEEGTIFTSGNPKEVVNRYCSDSKNIWLVGGGRVVVDFLNEDLIDEIQWFLIPVCLGSGIRLFQNNLNERNLNLREVKSYKNGVVMLKYSK